MPSDRLAATSRRGLYLVLSGACLLGLSAIFVKWALIGGASPVVIAVYRMVFALPLIGWLVHRDRQGLGHRKSALWALIAGAAFAGDLSYWHASMRYTSAANSTFIVCGLAPVWVALFSVVVYRARYLWLGWLGQGLGVTGALLLALSRGGRVGTGRGEQLAILSSFCYATFSLALAIARKRNSASQSLFWMSLGSLLTLGVIELVERQPLTGFSGLAWLSLFGLGFVVQFVAWLAINHGIVAIPIALGALALGFQQITTPFLAAWLLDEPLRPLGMFGGLLIVVGVYFVAIGVRRKT
jgi:drug/metabolite transporter (DMT)-like permease